MAGEPTEALELRWTGLAGDRRFAFQQVDNRTGFPWATGRDWSALVLHRAHFCDPHDPHRSPVEVVTPAGERWPADSPELAARIAAEVGGEVRLTQLGRGAFDAMPVSVASTATLAALDDAHGAPLDRRRFRLNIVIESDQPDSAWRGARLRFGDGGDAPALLATDGIPRCAMVTIDPDTATREPRVLRTVAQAFGNRLGLYAAPAALGTIRLGDRVHLAG